MQYRLFDDRHKEKAAKPQIAWGDLEANHHKNKVSITTGRSHFIYKQLQSMSKRDLSMETQRSDYQSPPIAKPICIMPSCMPKLVPSFLPSFQSMPLIRPDAHHYRHWKEEKITIRRSPEPAERRLYS